MNRYFGLHTLEGEWHALLPRYLMLSNRVRGARVLDVGCGSGLGSSLLLELGAQMVDAIDHRPGVLELARMKHAKQGLDFHVMLWEELGFPDDTFDLVICLDPSSPVTDPNLLREVRRVLKPRGEYACAIELRNVRGLEEVLPRYGYTNPAEHVDINRGSSTVPQIGELSNYFEAVQRYPQRPIYGFVFDNPPAEDRPGVVSAESRRIGDGGDERVAVSETRALKAKESPLREAQGAERFIDVDKTLCTSEADVAGVELLLCGGDGLQPLRLREVRLPYYSLTERLSMLIQDLQSRQSTTAVPHIGSQSELMDRGLDEATGAYDTDEELLEELLDESPTQIRLRPTLDELAEAMASDRAKSADLGDLVQSLAQTHAGIRSDAERLLAEARAMLMDASRVAYLERELAAAHHEIARLHNELDTTTTGPVEPLDRDEVLGNLTDDLAMVEDEDYVLDPLDAPGDEDAPAPSDTAPEEDTGSPEDEDPDKREGDQEDE